MIIILSNYPVFFHTSIHLCGGGGDGRGGGLRDTNHRIQYVATVRMLGYCTLYVKTSSPNRETPMLKKIFLMRDGGGDVP